MPRKARVYSTSGYYHMPETIKKEILHTAGIDIGIYTTDLKNEFISLTDITFEFAF